LLTFQRKVQGEGAQRLGCWKYADGNPVAETYNQLNAYFATVPGNYALNLRKLRSIEQNVVRAEGLEPSWAV